MTSNEARRRRRDMLAAAGFLSPALIALAVMRIYPMIRAVLDSLHRSLPGSVLPPRWAGLDNFDSLLHSSGFWQSVKQTLVFNVIINPVQVIAALLIAVLISGRVPAGRVWRTLIFLPSAIPLLGATVLWGIALRPDGLVNGALGTLGIGPQPFLGSPGQVLLSIILLASWVGVGYWMMFLIAGLQDIPAEYGEAAELDGAGPVRKFFDVTLPLLRRPLLFVLVADTVANFVLFAPIQVLTKGGPEGSSNLLMYDVYHNAFELSDPHTAAAELVMLLVLMLAIVSLQFRLLRSDEGSA
ncbi:MAG: multiple sugar transport system permease protein [Baekduia sp.]|nr:multiple sugar transport system permease protein [Baekduia sp.]